MAYLGKEDYTISSSIEDFNKILTAAARASTKPEDQIREESELTAQELITSYTSSRYDIALEFAKDSPDATRSRMIIKCNVDISLYYLHHTINPRQVPRTIKQNYDDCVSRLKGYQEGSMILPAVTQIEDPITNTTIVSQPKFISKPFQDRKIIRDNGIA